MNMICCAVCFLTKKNYKQVYLRKGLIWGNLIFNFFSQTNNWNKLKTLVYYIQVKQVSKQSINLFRYPGTTARAPSLAKCEHRHNVVDILGTQCLNTSPVCLLLFLCRCKDTSARSSILAKCENSQIGVNILGTHCLLKYGTSLCHCKSTSAWTSSLTKCAHSQSGVDILGTQCRSKYCTSFFDAAAKALALGHQVLPSVNISKVVLTSLVPSV